MFTVFAVLLAVLSCMPVVFASFQTGSNLTFSGIEGTPSIICIAGNVAKNTYIALGIPSNSRNDTGMMNAAIVLVYGSEFGPMLVQGRGIPQRPSFKQYSNTAVTASAHNNSYVNGSLSVCFESKDVNRNITTFLWATGNISKGIVQKHSSSKDRGVLYNVSLFDSVKAPVFVAKAENASLVSAGFSQGAKFAAVASAGPDGSKTTVCLTATVPTDSWISLGIPSNPTAASPVMEGSDFLLFYASSSGPAFLSGKGSNHAFVKNDALADLTLNAAKSSYAGGVLTGCVDIPAAKIPNSAASYIWATGKMAGTTPTQHTENGVATNVNLFGAGTAPAKSSGFTSGLVSLAGVVAGVLML
ncbi:UNVERIFIED_CONTAM: hypothetical protein HDU68_012031 [Siphonaria sp. JEL0065]|nr:hypothetical protein HDU68_012031 [Siphonaria sp. JEL0065]